MCAGAIDGTHIAIIAPKEDHTDYVNRKGYHNRDFKQRERGRRRGPQGLRENPNNQLRMTGGKKFDVLRSAPT